MRERAGLPGRGRTAAPAAPASWPRRAVPALAGAVVLAQIAYPLTPAGTARDRLTVATVLLFAAASVLHAATSRGARAAVALVVVAGGGGLLAEAVGVATGVPFGSYSYAGTLGPTVLGVPLVIPLAWVMMAWPAYLAGVRLARGPLARVAVAAVALASWDLFLDPQMVDAGHWRWSDPSPALPGVPTVPLTNYAGWALVALVLMALLDRTVGTGPSTLDTVPYALYLWTYASSVLALAAFLGLPAAALWGGIGMGAVALPLAWSLRRPGPR
jgi:putative membrane protein